MILMSNGADGNNNNNDTAIWTTWEELLLAFAVKRHGLDDWETVAMELQNRHRSSSVFTSEICRGKYKHLRRRFENQQTNKHKNVAASGGGSDSDGDENNDRVDGDNGFGESFAWLEELRKLRVAELKQEVQRYDLSIESLQIKAKTLEEERKSSHENSGSVNIPDLDNQIKEERSENDKTAGQVDTQCGVTGKNVSCEDENRSCHESNSTENRQTGFKVEPEPEGIKPDPESLNPVEDKEDSCDDSSDRHEMIGKESQDVVNDEGDWAELRDSAAESKEGSQGTKESSDVQSSASLITRKYRDGELDAGGGGGGETATVVFPSTMGIKRVRRGAVELEPLFGVLDSIWSQKHGSMFEHRLEIQKTERYKKMIRQHVDLETVQSRIEDGSYSSCPAKFYVDLLLLVNNANVFFPKSSPESLAAHELRRLVMKELKNSSARPSSFGRSSSPRPQTKPNPERSDSLLAKHKSATPLIVCRKRSSISGKASSSGNNKAEDQDEDKPSSIPKPSVKSPLSTSNEEDGPSKFKAMKEKPVTGVRSMRRGSSSKGKASVSSSQSGPVAAAAIQKPISRSMPLLDNTDKAEASKVDKKKGAQVASTVKKKGAADFLKRIKKNEPGKGISPELVNNKYSGESCTKVKMDNIKKSDEKKDVRRSGGNSGGGSNKKNVKEDISPSKRIGRPPKKGKEVAVMGKRGREGEGEGSSKQPKKKPRR